MAIHRIVAVTRTTWQQTSNTLLKSNVNEINKYSSRYSSANKNKQTRALKTEKEKMRLYIAHRYVDYVKNYTKVLETRFPTAVKMYRVFSIGIKDFLRDLKTYITLRLKVTKDRGFSQVSRQDIELYQKMPDDMWRIAPVLFLSAVPFGNYIIFPLAFLKPKTMLCSHFWSIQQRAEFSIQDLKDRLKNNKPVFRALQARLDQIPDSSTKEKWRRVIGLLGSGVHPTPKDIIECKELFVKEPYQITDLTYSHMGYLLKMHGLKRTLFRTNKLKYRALLLLEMDKAIEREGGVDNMNTESLRYACLIRGLNGMHLTNQDMREWLRNWIEISANVDKSCYSLILHCPIFFAYNHPQNWVLIY